MTIFGWNIRSNLYINGSDAATNIDCSHWQTDTNGNCKISATLRYVAGNFLRMPKIDFKRWRPGVEFMTENGVVLSNLAHYVALDRNDGSAKIGIRLTSQPPYDIPVDMSFSVSATQINASPQFESSSVTIQSTSGSLTKQITGLAENSIVTISANTQSGTHLSASVTATPINAPVITLKYIYGNHAVVSLQPEQEGCLKILSPPYWSKHCDPLIDDYDNITVELPNENDTCFLKWTLPLYPGAPSPCILPGGPYTTLEINPEDETYILNVDLDSDLDNDGDIDDDDEALEEVDLGEIIRVNDTDDIDGDNDGINEEDDLQYLELKIEPALTKGKVWFTYNTSKVKLWKTMAMGSGDEILNGSYASATWDLSAGDTIPAYIFAEGLATTTKTDTEESRQIIVHWGNGSAECTDTLLTTVTKDLGHYAYFAAIPDYIKEKRSPGEQDYKLFEAYVDAPGGPGDHTHNIVAMLANEVTMSLHDARAASHWYYAHVLVAKPKAVVIANAAYFEETWPHGIARGVCVNGGAKMVNSRPLISGIDPIYASRGWVGQTATTDAWQYGVPIGGIPPEPPVGGSICAAVGGLLPMLTPAGGNVCPSGGYTYNTYASLMLGWTDNDVLYFIANDVASNYLLHTVPAINMQQLVQQLADLGAIVAYTLDGSASIALCHRNRLGNALKLYGTVVGKRHWRNVTWGLPEWSPTLKKNQRVSNYIIIDWKP